MPCFLLLIISINTSFCTFHRNVRDDIEQEDEMEAYLRFMEENPNVGVTGDEDEIYEYDEEGNVIAIEKKVLVFSVVVLTTGFNSFALILMFLKDVLDGLNERCKVWLTIHCSYFIMINATLTLWALGHSNCS